MTKKPNTQWLKNKRGIIVTLVMAFLWSWIFLVDVTNLAKSTTMGFLLMLVAYAVMVAISSFTILRLWPVFTHLLRKPSWKSIMIMLLVWAAAEFLQAWLLAVVWMGREGSWSNLAPFVTLTPIVVLTPLKFLTRLFGYFGTSAVIGTGVLLLIACVKNTKWRKLAAYYWVLILALNILLWLGFAGANGPTITTTITSEHLGEPQRIDTSHSDLVLVPEYGLDAYFNENITDRFTDNSREIFFSGTKQYGETDGNKNVLVYGSNKQGFMYEHTKSRLIMAGEYIPFTYELFVRTVAPDLYTDFQVRRGIVKGKAEPHPFMLSNGIVLGNAACSSIIHPDDYRKLTTQGATLLGNSASLEVFRGSRVFALHHDGLATFMATANARPFLQAANDWKGFAIDHNGNKITQVQPVGQTDVAVKTNSKKTPYTYVGEWLTILGLIFIVGFGLQKTLRSERSSKQRKS